VIYDPANDTWRPAGKLAAARDEATAVLLQDGRVLLIGGTDLQRVTVFNSVEVYDPTSNAWQQAAPLAQARYEHTATLLPDGRVLVVGGWKSINGYEEAVLNTAEIYDDKRGTWTTLAPLSMGRVIHTTTLLPDGRILVTGGQTSRGVYANSAEVLGP
jgi:N-acetylneuraminic acid mutarotase